jgi:carboxyl-terminal processing protease
MMGCDAHRRTHGSSARRRTARALASLGGIALVALVASCAQDHQLDETRRLAGLGQVWGLLKYFHPQVAQRADWDAVLISAVPRVRAAESQDAFNREIQGLIDQAGPLASASAGVALNSRSQWINDEPVFLPETRQRLRAIVAAHSPGPSLYVSPVAYVHNPDFTGDQGYASAPQFPDEATRLLALFRYWNMVQYFFPYRDVMDRNWLEVLPELIPKFVSATNALEYNLAVAEMTASIDDGHAYTGSQELDSYFGLRRVPIDIRLVENQTVITRVYPRLFHGTFNLHVGDLVTHIDGVATETRRAALRGLLYGSNEVSLERTIHDTLQRTNAASLPLTVVEGGNSRVSTWNVNTVPLDAPWKDTVATHGSVSAILPGNIGYVHMGWLQVADVEGVMARLRSTRAIVFDARNYPNMTLYALSNYLNPGLRPFAKFQEPDFDHPGGFLWTPALLAGPGSPNQWYAPPATYTYTGRIAILVNEETISQAEFTVMALRTAPAATVIGSQTAGADGNVSNITLPGQIHTRFTGLGVFYPDGRATQRVGIGPDITVTPTIQGLREGRDEVLDAALAFLD